MFVVKPVADLKMQFIKRVCHKLESQVGNKLYLSNMQSCRKGPAPVNRLRRLLITYF